jgi:hypothetical protein
MLFKNIIWMINSRWVGWAELRARMGHMRHAYKILVGKPEGKIPLGRTRRRWKYNIKMDLRKTGWEDVNGTHLAQDTY